MPTDYQFPDGFHIAHMFPVEAESAIAELWYGDTPWASLELRGINEHEVGDRRLEDAVVYACLYAPPAGTPARWSFPLEDVLAEFTKAREWLLENERGRVPAEVQGSTAAAVAMDKMSQDSLRSFVRDHGDSDPDSVGGQPT